MTGVLLKAVSAGRPRQVRLLLDSGIPLETTDDCGQTALIRSVFLENRLIRERLVKLLLKFGAKINKADIIGRTPLSWGCIYGRDKEVKWMLHCRDVDLDLNQVDCNGQTALYHAATSGNAATVKLIMDALMKYDMNIEIADQRGVTPLMQAIKFGHDVCASILIHQGGATIGKDMKSAEDVEYATSFWADQCSDDHQKTKHHFRDITSKQNSKDDDSSIHVDPAQSCGFFPPIFSSECAQKIKYQEERARRCVLEPFPESEDEANSCYGSDISSLTDDSREGIGRKRSGYGGRKSVLSSRHSSGSYRAVSLTSSTEANVDSSDDEVDYCSRPIQEKQFLPSRDLPHLYKVYEQQKSSSYRPGAARPLPYSNDQYDSVYSSDTSLPASKPTVTVSKQNNKTNTKGTTSSKHHSKGRIAESVLMSTKRSLDLAVNSSSDSDLSEKLFTPAKRGLLPKITPKNSLREEVYC